MSGTDARKKQKTAVFANVYLLFDLFFWIFLRVNVCGDFL